MFAQLLVRQVGRGGGAGGSYLFSVLIDILKGFRVIDSEDTQEALPCPHVLVPHGTETHDKHGQQKVTVENMYEN